MNWIQCNFIQTKPVWADATCAIDMHDGWTREDHEEVKKEVRARDKAYRESRDRLKEDVRFALEGPADEGLAEELASIAIPQKTDSKLLSPHELVDVDKLMERLELRLRIEEMAARRRQEEDDDETLLLLH